MPSSSPRLWIVATPIGNIEDFSPRARSVLAAADLILAEDTRRARALLTEAGIKPAALWSFFEHNEQARQEKVLQELGSGKTVALITDAGTPLLSDPGYRLVRACRKLGFPVSTVPGPSAPLAALAACGIAPLPFTFLGFLPRSEADRARVFGMFRALPSTLIFFERKNRLSSTLAIAHDILGDRDLAICRELTKIHEEYILDTLANGARIGSDLLGELTIVIGPPRACARTSEEEVLKLLNKALDNGKKTKDAAREVKDLVSGWSAGELYNILARDYRG